MTGENHNSGYPSFIASYDYDHNGNRLHKTQNGQTDTYTYQANAYNSQIHTDELQSVSGGLTGTKTYGYDANGVARSITTNGTTLYLTADAEDRYTRFDFNTGPGAGTAYAYETYNGAGLRVLRHDVWGRNFPEAYDGASPGSPLLSSDQTLFTPGLMQQDSGAQHFYQTDALGSVRGFTNNAQAPLGEVYFDAFGLPSVRQGSMPWPLGFAGASGYQTDTDTGLMLLGNRYYDPSIGRFLSPDKVHDGNNWYAYCGNDPLTHTDPTGNVFQVSPTTMTSQGQLHGMLEGMRGSLEDDGWNHSFDAQWNAGKKYNYMTITYTLMKTVVNSKTGAIVSQQSLGERKETIAVPPGASLYTNAIIASGHNLQADWFTGMVHPGGAWDYKTIFHDNNYTDFGNVNYGIAGTAAGFSPDFLRNAAGLAAHLNGSDAGHPEWGSWGVGFRGDQPRDQQMIGVGIGYYNQHYRSIFDW